MPDEPGRKEQLSPARRELLRRRLTQSQEQQRPPPGPRRGEAGSGPQPLSFAQERFWFLEQLEPGSADYSMTGAGRMAGPLDSEALRAALSDLVARHDALRMCFPAVDGVPSQQLAEHGAFELPLLALDDVPPQQRDDAVREHTGRLHRRGFDLSHGPLLRAVLMRFAADDHGLALSMHHIVSDGWSLGVLMQDLATLYNAHRQGRDAKLPEPDLSYADWAHWQRQRLSGDTLEQLVDHWREALSGAPSHLELPHDLARPPLPGHAGATHLHQLPDELVDALRARASQLGATLFVTLLAAFKAYLLRISGETDLVLGTSIANRDHVHLRRLLGPCLNTLALRTRCRPEQSFAELVEAVRTTVHGALARPELPFEKLVDALQPLRDPSRSPIFNVFFDMTVPLPDPQWDGLQISTVEFERGTALFDLCLAVEDRGRTITCALQFNTELFLPETATRLWHHFVVLLRSALSDPQRSLDELELLDDRDRAQLQEWAEESELAHDRRAWVQLQFAAQAAATPAAPALIEGDQVMSYGELDGSANAFAWRLADLGAGPDVLVGVCLPRSSAVLVTILAIWKAGAVYLPLDPDDPPERLALLADDTRAPVIVTVSTLAARFAGLACVLVCLDELDTSDSAPKREHERAAPPAVDTSGQDLAYVIFTSGSTGEPKGVMVSHAALTNHIAWVRSAFDISPADRFVLRTPFSFDASIWEIVHPLVSGASLLVAPPGLQRDPAGLLALVAAEGVTVLQTVPSMLRSWLDEPRFGQATSLRHLICAGEALLPDLVARFDERCLAAGLPTRLHNLYGPSEATIDATMHSCRRGPGQLSQGREAVPIGRPISNTAVHVLDARRRLLPVGVVGELGIAGEGLAGGYLNRPDLTRERFVSNPVGDGRLYLTGDLGRRLPDGSLEYVGRVDDQVKVNGYRIELGEVEASLAEHPDVVEVAVIADGAAGDQRRLLAYLVTREGCHPEPRELRMFLEQRLPRYMVPSAFMLLPELPRTSSEKLDRRALPRLKTLRSDRPESFEPPVTADERTLARIMAELLAVDRVGLHDDFFAHGGHSLLATRLSARIRESLGVEIPLMDFFEQPTVAALAAMVVAGQQGDDDSIQPVPAQADHPVSFGQQRLWFLSQLEPGATHYHMTGALRLRGALDVAALQRALDGLVARHDALHTVLRWQGGELRQLVLAPQSVTLEQLDLSTLTTSEARDAALRELLDELGSRPFDLTTAPLLRARLARLGPEDHALALCQHHIVSDGRSLQLLLNDMGRLYDAARHGRPASLAALAVGTVDHAHWQRKRLDEQRLGEEIRWWQQALDGAPATLELPTDRPRPATPSHRGHLTCLALSDALSERFRQLAREQETTLFVVLAASIGAWLSRLTGERDLVIGTAVDQRTRAELEPLLGFFVNILPLRLDLGGEPSFAELIARTRRTVGAALSHRELPFEHLVDQLAPGRDGSRPPLFNVSFDLLSAPRLDDALPGLDAEVVAYDPGTAKLDLGVAIEEQGGSLQVWLEAGADLFERDTVCRLWQHWESLAADLVAQPQRSIEAAALLTPDEQAWLLRDCQTAAPTTSDNERPLARLLHWAETRPEATALHWGDTTISYGELVRRVRDIAGQLAGRQLGPNALVALCLPRSPDQLACQLACWWIGAAWLPLDVNDPPLRRQQLLNLARPQLLLCDGASDLAESRTSADGTRRPPRLVLDDRAEHAEPPAPVLQAAGDSRAYVTFTSGSTGTPKGVSVGHEALTRVLLAMHEQFQLSVDDRLVQRIPWTFDASLLELLLPLQAGCPLVIAGAHQATDPDAMARLVVEQQVTVLLGVPSFVAALIDRLHPGQHSVRLVGCGGEALPPDMPQRVSSRLAPHTELHNMYGPTEATIVATVWRCDVSAPDEAAERQPGSLPIGLPVPETRAHVVDDRGRLLPVGVTGELCLAGPCLADGYLHDPRATAAAFVPDPFDDTTGARLYRTGDLARRRADGTLLFVGRSDSQVKIAGQRIELGEIETLLAGHAQVSECALAAVGQRATERRLVAWVCGAGARPDLDLDLDLDALREWLTARLPQAMVPSTWVRLPALPRTSTDKIDRTALVASLARPPRHDARTTAEPAAGAVAAGATAGTAVADAAADDDRQASLLADIQAIFEELLGADAAGAHKDFFDSGGHSLLAIELTDRIVSRLDRQLPVQAIFEQRTPAALAELIRSRELGRDDPPSEPIDLFAEARLDPSVQSAERSANHPPAEVLLTGATGFLGAHLLAEWLQRSNARMHCLVRAADQAAAAERLFANLRRYDLDVGDAASRIVAVPGDLSAPRLGLDEPNWQRLAGCLDLVLHNGAAVDFMQGYRALRGANVEGTRSVLDLAARAGAALHFVSTLGVLMAPGVAERERLDEDLPLAELADVTGGYEQTKWVSEMLVQAAAERGLPVAIHRPGRIAGNSSSGHWAADDVAGRFLIGAMQLGAWPELSAAIDLSPVDWVAGAIVYLALEHAPRGETYHLIHPQPSSPELFARAAEARGQVLTRVSPNEWLRLARAAARNDKSHPLHLLLPLLPDIEGRPIVEADLVPDAALPPIGSDFTQRALSDGPACPAVDEALVARWLDTLIHTGQTTATESSP